MIYYALLFSPHWLLISSLLLASPDATHFFTFLFLSFVAAFAYCAYFSVLSKSFSCFCQLNLFTIKKEKKRHFSCTFLVFGCSYLFLFLFLFSLLHFLSGFGLASFSVFLSLFDGSAFTFGFYIEIHFSYLCLSCAFYARVTH